MESLYGFFYPAYFFSNFIGTDINTIKDTVQNQASIPLDQFLVKYVYPSPELADFMGGKGIILFGSDAASMDMVDSQTLPNHNALRRNGVFILENLVLTGVPDGEYELIALPLKIKGGDGSPVRAILRG